MIIYFLIFLSLYFVQAVVINYSFAHKLLDTPVVGIEQDKDNTLLESALMIPNHIISWAVYQQLGDSGLNNVEARFYKFDNIQPNSNFYAQITVPKIENYINFTPSLALIGPTLEEINNNEKIEPDKRESVIQSSDMGNNSTVNKFDTNVPFDIPKGYQLLKVLDYQGSIPSSIFYEPFTQTSYWERQEIKTTLNETGIYYIAVFNEYKDNGDGKYSLAIGKIEDFTLQDFFILLPYSWIKVKLFFNDYMSVFVASTIFIFLFVVLPLLAIIRHKRSKRNINIGKG